MHWQVALSCLHSPELLPAQTPLSAPKAPVHLRLLWSSSPLLAEVIYPLPSHLLITGNSGVGPLYPPKLAGVTPAFLDAIMAFNCDPLQPLTAIPWNLSFPRLALSLRSPTQRPPPTDHMSPVLYSSVSFTSLRSPTLEPLLTWSPTQGTAGEPHGLTLRCL